MLINNLISYGSKKSSNSIYIKTTRTYVQGTVVE